jgi:outer membrane protein TolC
VRSAAEAQRQRQETLALLARWRVASQRVEAAQRTQERAGANLLRLKSLYNAGGTRLLDLLDARQVYEEARQRLADARAESRSLRFEAEDRR